MISEVFLHRFCHKSGEIQENCDPGRKSSLFKSVFERHHRDR